MITNGEHVIDKVICVMEDGSNGAPCGACRELMVQLMPEAYKDIEIMVDYQAKRIVKLGDRKGSSSLATSRRNGGYKAATES